MKPIAILLSAFLLSPLLSSAQSIQFDHCVRHWKTNGPLPGLVRSYAAIDPSLPDSVLFSLTDTTAQTCLAVEVPESTVLAVNKFKIGLDKKDRPLNGVSVVDLVRIQEHILGINPLPSAPTMLAADANRSGSVTSYDVIQIINLILGKISSLTLVPSADWRYLVKRPANNFPFPPSEFAGVPSLSVIDRDSLLRMDSDSILITAFKSGDVDGDANLSGGIYTASPTGILKLTVPDTIIGSGDLFFVPFTPPNGVRLQAVQLEVVSKSPFLTLESFTSDYDFMATHLLLSGSRGRLTGMPNISQYPNGKTLSNGKPLFYLKVKATQPVALKDALALNTDSIPAIAFANPINSGGNSSVYRIDLTFSPTVAAYSPTENVLRATPATPNPFTDKAFVEIELPEAMPVLLEVHDLSGQLRWQQEQMLGAGKHQVEIPGAAVERGSMGLYRLRAGAGVATGRVVRM